MKFHHRKFVFTSILIGSLLVPLVSNAAQVEKRVGEVKVNRTVVRGSDVKEAKPKVLQIETQLRPDIETQLRPDIETRLSPLDAVAVIINPYCGRHYIYLPQNDTDSTCFAAVQPGVRWLKGVEVRITGGYTCRQNDDWPPDNACPDGTWISRWYGFSYSCNSANPIDVSQMNCYQTPGCNFTISSTWEDVQIIWDGSPGDPNRAYGFRCVDANEPQGFVPEDVCIAAGTRYLGSNIAEEKCCGYLEE